ncbi:MAG TPA: hypothetical protein VFC54_02180 [Pseudolabrys sp.]|nr:hypothetical protein [Pseudolabrys sp.]
MIVGVSGSAFALEAGPFARLAGQWRGSGTIALVDGSQEPIKCRASYDVLDKQRRLQLNIRCASDSYNFDLRGSAMLDGRTVTGSWSETARNAAGKISGSARGDKIDVVANGPGFTADLTLLTRGDRQTVGIKSKEPQSSLQTVTIELTRG